MIHNVSENYLKFTFKINLFLLHNILKGSRLADLHLILPNEVPQLSC